MKKKNKGFTLIELLAVIVILGLLMAIAIPSVTKYITQSRKKTLTNTIGNYMSALVNEVNDMVYTFTGTNTIYAVPIECVAVERGGTNPFGKWHQANDSYWAYVLVQYDDLTSSYKYGFTFKDSAGYGIYPTSQPKINEKGSQIVTGLNLSRPKNGLVTEITPLANWTGFDVNSTTKLKVLTAGSEDQVGNGVNTCTLVQKGDNYAQVEEDKEKNQYIYSEYKGGVENKDIGVLTWEQIIKDSKDGSYATKYKVGNLLTLTMKDKSNMQFRIVGINHDDLYDESGKAHITLISEQTIIRKSMNSDSNNLESWNNTELKDFLNEEYINLLIPDLYINSIKTVKKETYKYDNKNIETMEKMWIPSYSEVGLNGLTNDGLAYSYFIDKATRTKTGVHQWWWLRSEDNSNDNSFRVINGVGNYNVLSPISNIGVVIGFCI